MLFFDQTLCSRYIIDLYIEAGHGCMRVLVQSLVHCLMCSWAVLFDIESFFLHRVTVVWT